VVDGSPPGIFADHAAAWGSVVRHVAPKPALATPMGKVGNVLSGIDLASHERVIIADDDVRYDRVSLSRLVAALDEVDVARPQNYFDPLPWHACWDTSRILLNRVTGGDWPGTLAVRRSILRATGGYDGNAMFENLELVRTVLAAGGRDGAYLVIQLAFLPIAIALAATGHWLMLALIGAATIALAEVGRRRAGGTRAFPFGTSLFAPLWIAERAVCSWLAVSSRIIFGGVRYRGTVLNLAANPLSKLRARHGGTNLRGNDANPDHTARYRSA